MKYKEANIGISNGMSKIEERVMGNVAVIYAARRLAGATALKLYALVLSFVGIVAFVSIPNVAANFVNVAQGGVEGALVFIISAVVGTALLVQVSLVVAAVAAVSLVVPVFRGGRSFA